MRKHPNNVIHYGIVDGEGAAMNKKRLTKADKYEQLKRQTEEAGMRVSVRNGKVVVARKEKRK